jgi:hypothetical protein
LTAKAKIFMEPLFLLSLRANKIEKMKQGLRNILYCSNVVL